MLSLTPTMKYAYPLLIRLTAVILLSLSGVFSGTLSAQFVDLGQDPASVRWKQIRTDDFQLIYPDFFEENAQQIANLYTRLYQHANSLGIKAKRMSMLIRANGAVSNGNAGWAPKKSELYAPPPQDPSETWLEHLCIHEFRHIVQYDKVNQGLSRVLYYLFGEQYTMALIGVYVPMWLLEGDATVFETAAGSGGRGRSPEFLNEIKAQMVERGAYHYYKAVLGSYRDYVPSRYHLGYHLVGNSRIHYGDEIWQNLFERVGRRPLGITPVNRSLRLTLNEKRDSLWQTDRFQSMFINPDSLRRHNASSDAARELYRDNFSELREVWQAEAARVTAGFDTLPTHNRVYNNYHYPTPLEDGSVLAYKEGLDEAGLFVRLTGDREEPLFRPGVMYDYAFAVQQGTLLWSEYQAHPRWEHGGRMQLAAYDTNTGRYRRFAGRHNRYAPFAAGGHWGFVEVDRNNRASLVLIDHAGQQELFRLDGVPGELFIHPSWHEGHILAVSLSPAGKQLVKVDTRTGERSACSPLTDYELDNPLFYENGWIYRSALNGNNALYVAHRADSFGELLAEAPFGMRYPALSPGKDTLWFSFYTSAGYKPGYVSLPQRELKPAIPRPFATADTHRRMERADFARWGIDTVYRSKPYRKLGHAVNVHSWGVIFPDRDEMEIQFGLAVSSQNVLSSLYWSAGYVWDDNYDQGCWRLKLTYRGWWPTLTGDIRDGKSNWTQYDYNATNISSGQADTLLLFNDCRYTQLKATVQFPFVLNRGEHYRRIAPFFSYEWHGFRNMKTDRAYRKAGQLGALQSWISVDPADYHYRNPAANLRIMHYGISAYNQTRMNHRDLNPRWGQWVELGYQHTPFQTIDYGHSWWFEGRLWFPGLAPHHSLNAYFGYQYKSMGGGFANQVSAPRGTSIRGKKMQGLRTNYSLPLAYPDWHLHSLLYVKRITATLFYDTGKTTDRVHSFGIETNLDSHFFTLTFPVNIGLRMGYETQEKKPFVNLLFSMGLSI